VFFTAGAAGTGRVIAHAQVDGVAGDFIDTVIVNVTGAAATGIPFGLFGIKPDSLAGMTTIWTGGSRATESVTQVLAQLAAAENDTPRLRMWFNLAGGDEQRFKNADGSFNLQRWKDTVDYYATAANTKPFNADGSSQFYTQTNGMKKYIQDTTLLGFQMLDDLGNFSPALTFSQLEAMGAHAKLRYPGITTAVRQRPTKLASGTYAQLNTAWAQYEARPAASDGDTPGQYRDHQIAAAQSRHLGLVLGMNIHDGGLATPGDIPPDTLLDWGQKLLQAGSSDYACSFIMWNIQYGNVNHPNMTTLANLAKSHVASSCLFH
jgi:hypothetical protein